MNAMVSKFSGDLQAALQEGRPFAIATLLRCDGHVPQNVGAKAIIDVDGLFAGTVGGGKLEARAISSAQGMLRDGIKLPQVDDIDLQRDLGMTCGGRALLAIEPFYPTAWHVAVFGAGHVAQALVPLLCTLDCQVDVVDQRQEWLDRLAAHARLRKTSAPGAETVKTFPANTHYLIVTQGHAYDLPILKEVIRRRDFGYVGVIGSVVKRRSLKAALLQSGFTEEETKVFETPMGLPIGSNSPAEIAISIVARLLQIRDAQ